MVARLIPSRSGQGIRYSNGDVVSPEDFRWALERGFPLYTSVHRDLYGVLVGGEDCLEEPRQCDLSRGVVTDEEAGTITFHLVEPDPEFLYKLRLPFAYPAPPSTSEGTGAGGASWAPARTCWIHG